jgi:beta-glucosidase
VADILFGDVNPGGKLPVCFPRNGSHAPLYYARTLTHSARTQPDVPLALLGQPPTPLYPFGFGLSYTTFAFANLQLSAAQVKVGETVDGNGRCHQHRAKWPGTRWSQLYIHQRWGSDSRPCVN